MKSLSRVQLFATPWTVAYQAPPTMGFSRQEYWSGLPFPSPTYISIITLNVNRLNVPPKRHGLARWIQKQDPYICCPQETHFRPKDTDRLKVRGWKNIFHANGKQKKAGAEILISDKIDLKIKKITRDKEGHYIMIKGSIQEENITIVNVYAPNIGAPQYIRQTLTDIKGEIDSNTIIAGDRRL